jgi:hybrid cluster-associated redox disulfide protein
MKSRLSKMIHKEMTILQVLQLYPEAYKVLENFGMKCGECLAVGEENLEKSARRHNVNLLVLLAELNKLAEQTNS